YSIDQNLWGRSIECGALEVPMVEPPEDVWETTVDPVHAPREPTYLEIGFAHGVPVSVDGEVLALRPLIARIEQAAGSYGVGRVDMIEDRVVGIKSREIYEIPASATLLRAHADLEELTLDREVLRTKHILEQRYAQLVYEGYWYSPLREALDAFCDSTQHDVNGTVRLRLEPGAARVVGRSSEGSLYDLALATYERGDAFDHTAGAGFIKLWGLALKSWSRARRRG
ncbi:MAG: argininosuccinate synthase, partial [Actinomycetota bacterium]